MKELTSEEQRVLLRALREFYENTHASRVQRGIAYRLWSRFAHPDLDVAGLRHVSRLLDPFEP